MPQPTGGDLYVSRPLTNISVAYMQNQTDFAAPAVFPNVPVDHQYGIYYTYNKGDWFRTAARKRAPATESAGTGWRVGTDNYRAEVEAVHKDVADQDRANQDAPTIDLDRDATLFVTRDLLLRRELDFVASYFQPGVWANADQTGVAIGPAANQFLQWNLSASTPIEDITAQRITIAETTGLSPNILVLGARVFQQFKNHPDFLERIKYSERGIVTLDLIAAVLDIDRVVVPMVVQNSAAEGAADDMNFIYGKSALLVYAPPTPGRLTPSAGYTFSWNGYLGAGALGTRVKKFRMEPIAADRVEGESAYDMKVVSTDLAVFFEDAVA